MEFSICAETFFTELPFEERLSQIAAAGFKNIEFWSWRDKDIKKLKKQIELLDINIVNFSAHRTGNLLTEKGFEVYKKDLVETVSVAKELGCKYLMLLTDELSGDGSVKNNYGEHDNLINYKTVLKNLKCITGIAEENKIDFVLEPLNTIVDHPGYYLNSTKDAFKLIEEVDSSRLKILYDIYHMQIMEGNLIATIKDNLDKIGYFHVADVPGRHEPGTGEINYFNLLRFLKSFGYNGIVGFECFPKDDSVKALEVIKELSVNL